MYAQILAAFLLIPFGLATLMRGSDALNAGTSGAGEAGVMALSGAAMILSGVALLLGAVPAGALALMALSTATIVWARQRRRIMGAILLSELRGRAALLSAITVLIVAGWR